MGRSQLQNEVLRGDCVQGGEGVNGQLVLGPANGMSWEVIKVDEGTKLFGRRSSQVESKANNERMAYVVSGRLRQAVRRFTISTDQRSAFRRTTNIPPLEFGEKPRTRDPRRLQQASTLTMEAPGRVDPPAEPTKRRRCSLTAYGAGCL